MLIMFIILSLICIASIGFFIGIIVNACVEKHGILYGVITAIIIGVIAGGLITIEEYGQKQDWNNGICIKCGGKYKFKSASKSMHGYETLYYTCEDCDYLIRQ